MSIRFEWRDNNAGSVLLALRDDRLAKKAVNAMAQEFKADVLGYIEDGHSFTNRDKHQKFIKWQPESGGARVYTRARHLVWMEQGTGTHVIGLRAKNKRRALRFMANGSLLFRKLVQHPGTQPLPFFFADMSARQDRMIAAARAVYAPKMQAS